MTTDSPAKPSALRRITTVLIVLAAIVAIDAYPLAAAIKHFAGRDVILLQSRADDATVALQRDSYDDTEKDPDKRRRAIVEIYGSSPNAAVERVLFVDEKDVIVPPEDRTLALLPPAKDGSHPIQAKSADFAAKLATIAGVAAFVVLLLLRRFIK